MDPYEYWIEKSEELWAERAAKYARRDRKRHQRRHGHKVTGRSLFTIINVLQKRAATVKETK